MILLATYYLLLSIITIAIVHIQEEREGRVLQEAFYLTGMCPYQSLTNTISIRIERKASKNNMIARTAWFMRNRCQKRPCSLLRIVL